GKRCDGELLLQPGQAPHGVRPRVEPVPGPVELVDAVVGHRYDSRGCEQVVEHHAMQVVDPGPRKFTPAHSIHRRGISGPPAVGEARPILLHPMALAELLELANDAGTPINDGPEHVERQGKRVHHGSRTSLPCTPPLARLSNASPPFDSGTRTGGGGRRPASTSFATPEPNSD